MIVKGIRIIDTRHEVNAVFAADAVARLSGNIGVAAVTAGPGLTNTITAIKNAQMAESPVLLLGGAAANLLKGRGALQDIDQMALFKSLCKYCATIRYVKDIPSTLRKVYIFFGLFIWSNIINIKNNIRLFKLHNLERRDLFLLVSCINKQDF